MTMPSAGAADNAGYKVKVFGGRPGWCSMICDRTETDQDAIDMFFSLLAEFKARTPHVVARLIGYKKTYLTSRQPTMMKAIW